MAHNLVMNGKNDTGTEKDKSSEKQVVVLEMFFIFINVFMFSEWMCNLD
jgi:hypothetical protein